MALIVAQVQLWTRKRGGIITRALTPPDSEITISQLRRGTMLGWAISRAARYGIFRPLCLARSIALQRMLMREGILGSRLRIGVRPEGHALKAHAWVTLNDIVVGDDPEFVSRYKEMPGMAAIDLL